MPESNTVSTRARIVLWNLLMVSVVLLPSFFVAAVIELTLTGASLTRPSISYQVGAGVVEYISLWLEVAPASVIHSVVMMFLPLSAALWTKKSVGYLASTMVLGIPMLLDSGTALYLSSYWTCTVTATLVYAYASASMFMKYSVVGGAPESGKANS